MVEFSSGLKGMALNLETELQSYAHTSRTACPHDTLSCSAMTHARGGGVKGLFLII